MVPRLINIFTVKCQINTFEGTENVYLHGPRSNQLSFAI